MSADKTDIFGVYAPPLSRNMPPVTEPDVYPFTPSAEAFFDNYDPVTQDARTEDDCAAETAPGILWDNSPMELVDEGDTVVMRFERLAMTCNIHMSVSSPPPDTPIPISATRSAAGKTGRS